jgi:hypothetical protein
VLDHEHSNNDISGVPAIAGANLLLDLSAFLNDIEAPGTTKNPFRGAKSAVVGCI